MGAHAAQEPNMSTTEALPPHALCPSIIGRSWICFLNEALGPKTKIRDNYIDDEE